MSLEALKLLHDFGTPCCEDGFLESRMRIIIRWRQTKQRWEASADCSECKTDLTYLCLPLVPNPVGFVWARPLGWATLNAKMTADGGLFTWRTPLKKPHPLL